MEVILKFDFDKENDDRSDFEDAINGTKWKLAVEELDNWLRGNIKHPSGKLTEAEINGLEKCREELHEILRRDSLSIF